jgi:hypothetical protein
LRVMGSISEYSNSNVLKFNVCVYVYFVLKWIMKQRFSPNVAAESRALRIQIVLCRNLGTEAGYLKSFVLFFGRSVHILNCFKLIHDLSASFH